MFQDVVQFTDFIVGGVERYEGLCTGERLCAVIAWCEKRFGDDCGVVGGSKEVVRRGCTGDDTSGDFVGVGCGRGDNAGGAVGSTGDGVGVGVGDWCGSAAAVWRRRDVGVVSCWRSGGDGDVVGSVCGRVLCDVVGSQSSVECVDGVKVSSGDSCEKKSDADGPLVEQSVCGKVEKKEEEKKKKKLGSRARRRLRAAVGGCAGDCSGNSVPEWRRDAAPVVGNGGGSRPGRRVGGFPGVVMRARVDGPRGFFSEASEETRALLRETRAERLAAENRLAAFKARRQFEVESSQDVVQLKKRQETRLLRDTECNKVQIERAYGTLAATGNVPGVGSSVAGGGKVEGTVVTNGTPGLVGGSISPNSSASMKEFHAAQKQILSQAKDIEDLQRKLDHLKLVDFEAYCKIGGGRKRPETIDTGFTLDTNGEPTGQLGAAYSGYVGDDGRFHMGENPAIYDNW